MHSRIRTSRIHKSEGTKLQWLGTTIGNMGQLLGTWDSYWESGTVIYDTETYHWRTPPPWLTYNQIESPWKYKINEQWTIEVELSGHCNTDFYSIVVMSMTCLKCFIENRSCWSPSRVNAHTIGSLASRTHASRPSHLFAFGTSPVQRRPLLLFGMIHVTMVCISQLSHLILFHLFRSLNILTLIKQHRFL